MGGDAAAQSGEDKAAHSGEDKGVAEEVRLGDGCYHVFLDAGSNRGVHGRFLFEPELYRDNGVSHIFDEVFGNERKSMPICVFAFEPNPFHVKTQRATQKAYQLMGWRYTFLEVGVSDAPGTMKFYRNAFNGNESLEYWAFSTINLNRTDVHNTPMVIPVIDFAGWIRRHILHRRIPAFSSTRPPRIMAKMDIEGLELPLLTHMVLTGVACHMHTLILELHRSRNFGAVHMKNNITLSNKTDKVHYFRELNDVLSAGGCSKFRIADSEAYLHDGRPLPRPGR